MIVRSCRGYVRLMKPMLSHRLRQKQPTTHRIHYHLAGH
jgi:hypothetical protein